MDLEQIKSSEHGGQMIDQETLHRRDSLNKINKYTGLCTSVRIGTQYNYLREQLLCSFWPEIPAQRSGSKLSTRALRKRKTVRDEIPDWPVVCLLFCMIDLS